jgi:hypothetical protein
MKLFEDTDPRAIRDVPPRQRAIYGGAIRLLLGGNARNFHTQAVITGKLLDEEGSEDHRVFPMSYLERQGIGPPRLRYCVLNRTLNDRTTNQMISDRRPSDYPAEICETPGFTFAAVLASHGLPADEESPLLRDEFECFLEERQQHLWKMIRRVTGATSAADLEIEEEAIT